MFCLHGQLGRKDRGGGFKLTFRFLYWGLINQERKYTRRKNLGGNDDLLSYGHVPGSTKSCGPFVSLGTLCDLRCQMCLFLWATVNKV